MKSKVQKPKFSATEIKTQVKKLFQSAKSDIELLKNNDPYPESETVRQRREEAIVQYTPIAIEKFEDDYQKLDVEYRFIQFCCYIPGLSVGYKNELYLLPLAAAIWILDDLKESGNIEKLQLKGYGQKIDLPPNTVDAANNMTLLKEIYGLIIAQKENGDPKRIESEYFNSVQALHHENKAFNPTVPKAHQDFLDLCGLLQPERVQQAVQNIEKNIWEIFDLHMKCIKNCNRWLSHRAYSDSKQSSSDEVIFLNDSYVQVLITQIAELMYANGIMKDINIESNYKTMTEFDESFTIESPYETCFAFFYLLATGSNLVWLYVPFIPLLDKAALMLPWNLQCMKTDRTAEQAVLDANLKKKYAIAQHSDIPKSNITIPSDIILSDSADFSRSCIDEITVDQMVYFFTGIIPPRNDADRLKYTDILQKHGFSEEKAEGYGYLLAFASAVSDKMNQHIQKNGNEPLADTVDNKNEQCILETLDENARLAKDIEILKKENAQLQESVQQKKHQIQKQKMENQRLEKETNSNIEELTFFREYFHFLEQEKADVDETDTVIQFPYRTNKKILCFGGTDVWRNNMKQKLPDVIFYPNDSKPNTDALKYADEVWYQWQYSFHKDYYRIRNICREKKTPLNFFTNKGAAQCAEQFARYEMKHK